MKRTVIMVIALILPLFLFAEKDETQDAVNALLRSVDLSEWDAWFSETAWIALGFRPIFCLLLRTCRSLLRRIFPPAISFRC